MLSLFLFNLYNHHYTPGDNNNSIVKYSDDNTIIGGIANCDESSYRDEINSLAERCAENNLLLNVSIINELINFNSQNTAIHKTEQHIGHMAFQNGMINCIQLTTCTERAPLLKKQKKVSVKILWSIEQLKFHIVSLVDSDMELGEESGRWKNDRCYCSVCA